MEAVSSLSEAHRQQDSTRVVPGLDTLPLHAPDGERRCGERHLRICQSSDAFAALGLPGSKAHVRVSAYKRKKTAQIARGRRLRGKQGRRRARFKGTAGEGTEVYIVSVPRAMENGPSH
jgi:hypothetical protein